MLDSNPQSLVSRLIQSERSNVFGIKYNNSKGSSRSTTVKVMQQQGLLKKGHASP